MRGLSWGPGRLPAPLPEPLADAATSDPLPAWQQAIQPNPNIPGGRQGLVELNNVEAPLPKLNDLVDEAFHALRGRLAGETGWDLLSALENAYVPLTAPLPPGLENDWLYTGRAIAISPAPVNAGWMMIAREDYGQQTYWRVFLRARFQDGSQGEPLHTLPWQLTERYNGNPQVYEAGGALATSIPAGYWVDLTRLASAYGWERIPALPNWQTFLAGARFNEFVLTQGLDWRSAMLELYPPEVLITPTIVIPPTRTLTPTPRWYRSPTPTASRTPLPTFTPSPTLADHQTEDG